MTAPKTKGRKRSRAERIRPVYFETRLSGGQCRKCRRPLLIGTVKGEHRKIDKTRLSQAGELLALLAGCRTYQTQGFDGTRLFQRRAAHITEGMPPYGRIHAEHRCGMVWAPEHYDLRDLYPTYRGDECPY